MVRIYAVAAAAAVAGVLGGTFVMPLLQASEDDRFAPCRASAIAGGTGSIGGPFELINSAGKTVTDAEIITKPTLLYFGYTFCPDVCPLDLARNAEAMDELANTGYTTQGVFITIDPERDTPEVVGEYAGYMHEDMIGLTGSPEQVKAASTAYRTYYRAHAPEEGDDFYLVDHSTQSYLVLPEHGFVEFFNRNDTAKQIAERVGCFIDNA